MKPANHFWLELPELVSEPPVKFPLSKGAIGRAITNHLSPPLNLCAFASLREIFLRFRGSAPRVLGSLRDKVDKPRRDA